MKPIPGCQGERGVSRYAVPIFQPPSLAVVGDFRSIDSKPHRPCGCHRPTSSPTGRARFPVVSAPGCRNELLNSQKLFLADKAADYRRIGLWASGCSYHRKSTGVRAGGPALSGAGELGSQRVHPRAILSRCGRNPMKLKIKAVSDKIGRTSPPFLRHRRRGGLDLCACVDAPRWWAPAPW